MATGMPNGRGARRGVVSAHGGGIGVLPVVVAAAAAILALPASGAVIPNPLPDPDGKPADITKPVQVYILMGQSNMVGAGKISKLASVVKEKGKYPYLVDDAGNWTVRKDVRNVRVMSSGTGKMREFNNEWMTIKGRSMGPEFGIGHYVGHVVDAPVMILKSCIGNRSLGWDLLPPGSERYEFQGKVYAGYKDSPASWAIGTEPKKIGWYAGMQYDGDTANAKTVLNNFAKYYPGATRYEVAGFFFWQGDKDRYNAGHATRYEKNLVHFIKQLRKDFNAPNAKFVCATLGQTRKGAGGNEGLILNAQLAVDGKTGKYPDFRGNVASVYSNPLSKGGSSNGHYGGNPETYMNVGEGMGRAMADDPQRCGQEDREEAGGEGDRRGARRPKEAHRRRVRRAGGEALPDRSRRRARGPARPRQDLLQEDRGQVPGHACRPEGGGAAQVAPVRRRSRERRAP
ncbi:MAG: sialate O-acetylesterase [Planctomycetota bacterium]